MGDINEAEFGGNKWLYELADGGQKYGDPVGGADIGDVFKFCNIIVLKQFVNSLSIPME